MTNTEIEFQLGELIQDEREIKRRMISIIALAEDRRIYAERGKESMFEWLTKHYGMSEASAQRRISAAKLLKVMPEAAEKLETGELNLSVLCAIQSSITQAEKKAPISAEKKRELIKKATGKSVGQTREILAAEFPNQAPPPMVRPINADQVTITFTISKQDHAAYEEAKSAYSNTNPKADIAEITVAAWTALVQITAKKQSVRRRTLLKKANNQCEWTTPKGERCQSKHQLEEDHIIPKAKGGSDKIENRRMLCRAHNQLHAEQCFGRNSCRATRPPHGNKTQFSK